MIKKNFSFLILFFITSVVFSQNESPVIYQGLLDAGAETSLTQEVITYFKNIINELSVHSDNIEMSGYYRINFFPVKNKQIGIRIIIEDNKYKFVYFDFISREEYREYNYYIAYKKLSDSQFYLKNGLMIYITIDGIYGTSVLPDGSIDGIFYLEFLRQ